MYSYLHGDVYSITSDSGPSAIGTQCIRHNGPSAIGTQCIRHNCTKDDFQDRP